MSGRRCAEPRCGRFVGAGAWCRLHRPPDGAERASGGERAGGVGSPGPERGNPIPGGADGDPADAGRTAFRRGMERGDYRALLDERVQAVLAQAAGEPGLGEEIGALRYVLKRLLAEEEDLSRLAAGVARVAGVAVRAARANRALSGEAADGLTAALTQILAELDAE